MREKQPPKLKELTASLLSQKVPVDAREVPDYIRQEYGELYQDAMRVSILQREFQRKWAVGTKEATFQPVLDQPNLPYLLLLTTDDHFGSVNHNYELWHRHTQMVLDTPNMGMINNGDSVDNFNAAYYPTGIFDETMPPNLQARALIDRYHQLAEKGKLGVLAYGNHNQSIEVTGLDWLEVFARHLGVPMFTEGTGFLHLLVGDQHYGIGMAHRYWGYSKLNPTNPAKRMLEHEYPQADIIFLGHFHQSESLSFERGQKEKVAVMGGTYKNADAYASQRGIGGRGGSPGHAIMFWPDQHRMVAFKDIEVGHDYLQAMVLRKQLLDSDIKIKKRHLSVFPDGIKE